MTGKQLVMFLRGPGGSGKSAAVDIVALRARKFCELLDCPLATNTIVITAMPGVAATLLSGQTVHKKCKLMGSARTEDCLDWQETRWLIIDEISFAGSDEIKELDQKLRVLRDATKSNAIFGGLNIVFAGDFRQLEPAQKDSLCLKLPSLLESLNAFIELGGMHCFKHDLEWGCFLKKFRGGAATVEDIRQLNCERVVKKGGESPDGAQCAAHRNRARDVINDAVFNKFCDENQDDGGCVDEAFVASSGGLQRKSGGKTWAPISAKMCFYENLGEDGATAAKMCPRADPALKLHRDCPLMLAHNVDALDQKASGACGTLEQIILRPGEEWFVTKVDSGQAVRTCFASQVKKLVTRHNKDPGNPLLDVIPEDHAVTAKWPLPRDLRARNEAREMIPVRMTQTPVVRNSATAGHKLQGKTVNGIFAHEWHYATNWPRVVMPRVATKGGFHTRQELSEDAAKHQVPPDLVALLGGIREREAGHHAANECRAVRGKPNLVSP